ncbi:MAG: radical SAM protein, partial [Candidatus Omnitrophota bacterium]
MDSKQRKILKYIYGPVSSWRLGSSLGIDPISSDRKICTFDCVYCQLGPTDTFSKERKIYVETEKIIEEIKSLSHVKFDYITFSGRGEPTLAKNLGELIKAVRDLRKEKIAVLTNSSLMNREDVREDLSLTDFVIAKLDVPSQELLDIINKPVQNIKFQDIIEGIKKFKAEYEGRLALQIMFIDENEDKGKELATIAEGIKPDELEINTPLRPCKVKPLPKEEISEIKKHFLDIPAFDGTIVTV